MTTLDLTATTDKDGFVVYFGGHPNAVDTYTFANALVAFSDAFREINSQINDGFALELRLEAVGEGSFKAKVREIPTTLKGVFAYARHNVVMPVFVTFLYTHYIDPQKTEVIVNTDEVIFVTGKDRVIVPRSAYNKAQTLPNKGKVAAHVSQAIEAVKYDPNVTSLGILTELKAGPPPAFLIDRADFDLFQARSEGPAGKTRTVPEKATIRIIKAVIAKGDRKWEFVWNGVRISASIKDPVFLADLIARKYLIGAGDALEVVLHIDQERDELANVWLNTGYSVHHVDRYISAAQAQELDLNDDNPA